MKNCIVILSLLFSCLYAGAGEKTICRLHRSVAEIGIEGYQKFVFSKAGDVWEYEGVFASSGGEWVKVSDGGLFNVRSESLGVRPEILAIEYFHGRRALRIVGEGYSAVLSVNSGSPFIDRSFHFSFPESVREIREHDIEFIFNVMDCARERGFIGSYSEKDTVTYIFSPIPAIYSRIEKNDGSSLALTQVIDYYGSSPVFRKAMRVFDVSAGKVETGTFSCLTPVDDASCSYHDRIMVSDGSCTDFYDQLRAVRSQFSQLYPLNHKSVASRSRLTSDDYSVIASGLLNELTDNRAFGPLGSMKPYAYSENAGESFISFNIFRSLIKYAQATGNDSLYSFCLDRARMFVEDHDGLKWIENAYGFGDFLHNARDTRHFYDRDNTEVAGGRLAMGTYKGFERVDALGEVALFSGDAFLKDGFLRLARTIHEKMVLPDYCQPVCYALPSLEPLVGNRDGGSAGGAALWADIMLMASELTEGEESKAFLDDAVASARRAAALGFQQMWSIIDAPKPVAVSRTVSTLVELWKKTGDRSLLDSAVRVVGGLFHFYHYFNQTYSPFCTGGMGEACSVEKQEAAYESMLCIWQVAPLLDYVDDKLLLDLFVQARNSGYFFYPVNSQGIGTVHGEYRTYYEWPEVQYVPYEFSTGILNDPSVHSSTVDQIQNIFRETKEIYGSGETFAFSLLFDGKARSVRPEICCICTSANLRLPDAGEERFVIYNSSAEDLDAPVVFRNLKGEAYDIQVDGKIWKRKVAGAQLANGITFPVPSGAVKHITLVSSTLTTVPVVVNPKSLDMDCQVNSTLVMLQAEPMKDAAFYRLSVSRSNVYNRLNTDVMYSADGTFKLVPDGVAGLYCRMEAVGKDGIVLGLGEKKIDIPGMLLLAQDDFCRASLLSDRGGESGWTEINTDFRSDGSRGVMNILSEDVGYGTYEIQKTFEVGCVPGMRFEFLPYAIPDHCFLSVSLEIDGDELKLIDRISSLEDPVYSFPLDNLSGKKDIKVRICTEGYTGGCILECVRFVADSNRNEDSDVDMLGLEPSASSVRYDLSEGALHIDNAEGNAGTLEFGFTTDLSRNRNLVVDVENFDGMNEGAQWKLFLKDVETGEMLEARNCYEIEGYNPQTAFKTYHNPANAKYFRSKSGVYMYDVYTMFGIDGMHDYKLCLTVSGKCSLDIAVLYMTESNAQVPVRKK